MVSQKCKNNILGETVEKVPKQILGGDAEKNDLTECVTINDLIVTRGHETPENHPLTILKAFSTVSEEKVKKGAASSTYKAWRLSYMKIGVVSLS
jgi:UTP:GlnB (protein PII) uridylyltransferase